MDYSAVIGMILQAGIEIYKRHADKGEILTDAQVADALTNELAQGKHAILAWFLAKGRPASS